MRKKIKEGAVLVGFAAFVGGCTAEPAMPDHFVSLQQYFAITGSDIPHFYPRSDPDVIRQCYAEAMTRQVPGDQRPVLLEVVNKIAADNSLTTPEQILKAKWLDDRPRVEGAMLSVAGPNARAAHYEMAMICALEMLKK